MDRLCLEVNGVIGPNVAGFCTSLQLVGHTDSANKLCQ